jgi:hypothetical protein
MKLFTVTFDDSNVVVIEPGIEVHEQSGRVSANLGTDVGGATLAMIDLVIPVFGAAEAQYAAEGRKRMLLGAKVRIEDESQIAFTAPDDDGDRQAFVVFSVIQRSPDARTEVSPLPDGVECVANAFDRPMDKQVLVMQPGSRVQFRRFGRGGNFGPWHALAWDGSALTSFALQESAS